MLNYFVADIPYLPNPLLKASSRPTGGFRTLQQAKLEDTIKARSAIVEGLALERARAKVGVGHAWGMPWDCATLKIEIYVGTNRRRDLDNYIAMCKGFIDAAIGKVVIDDHSEVIRQLNLKIITDKAASPLTRMIFTRCNDATI